MAGGVVKARRIAGGSHLSERGTSDPGSFAEASPFGSTANIFDPEFTEHYRQELWEADCGE